MTRKIFCLASVLISLSACSGSGDKTKDIKEQALFGCPELCTKVNDCLTEKMPETDCLSDCDNGIFGQGLPKADETIKQEMLACIKSLDCPQIRGESEAACLGDITKKLQGGVTASGPVPPETPVTPPPVDQGPVVATTPADQPPAPEVDQIAPTLLATIPANEALNVSPVEQVWISFSEPLDEESLRPENIRWNRLGDAIQAVQWQPGYDPASHSLALVPSAPLRIASLYQVVISGVTDLAGNPMAETSFTFRTRGMVAAGHYHTVALKSDGTVWAWGNNSSCTLGVFSNCTPLYSSIPRQVITLYQPLSHLSGVTGLSAGVMHTVALKEDGTVLAWGANGNGQIGLGTTSQSVTVATAIPSLNGVKKVVAGGWHTVALKEDGTVWTWGQNQTGQLGRTATAAEPGSRPALVAGLNNVVDIAAGTSFTLALRGDGTVWSWGFNNRGQLGRQTGGVDRSQAPGPVLTINPDGSLAHLPRMSAIAAGSNHALALVEGGGGVYAWGADDVGQLGDGIIKDPDFRVSPVLVVELSGVVSIEAGGSHLGTTGGHSMALKGDGTIQSWGFNTSGQLGHGEAQSKTQNLPVQKEPADSGNLTGLVVIDAGGAHSVALKEDGTVWVWGGNTKGTAISGQLGLGDVPLEGNRLLRARQVPEF
ncbi:MAG: Ig-like domain-containing protein [Deltaproteobacteria bacterium]|nr:Ig-like domain-containing protein [Deltaproteobacteria bacterium]